MDRIAIISDIHGNMPALHAVLEDIESRGITRIFCLGDLAGKGPSSAEAVDKIKEVCETVVKGNWDYFLSDGMDPTIEWHREKLGEERRNYLRELQKYSEFYISGRLMRLCHASPNDIFHRTYIKSESKDRLKLFQPTPTMDHPADIVGYGDIHGAHVDCFNGKTVFNTGSVGNPLDITKASYAIVEGDYNSRDEAPFVISIVKVPYNIEDAVKHADESDMPDKEAYIKELKTGIYRGLHKK